VGTVLSAPKTLEVKRPRPGQGMAQEQHHQECAVVDPCSASAAQLQMEILADKLQHLLKH